jgi:hypothetical protein
MMRCVYSNVARENDGDTINDATVTVYLAGTSTLASIYTTFAGATATNSVTTNSSGEFTFYVDRFDYDSDQKFKYTVVKTGQRTKTYDNVDIDRVVISTYSGDKTLTTNLTIPKGVVYSGTITITTGNVTAGLYQVFTGTVTGLKEARPEWFGAKADNSTDSTAAFNIAINLSVPVKLQPGTYLVNAVHTTGNLIISGAGEKATFLKSYSATGYAWTESNVSSDWTKHLVMNDIGITGTSGQTRNGFVFGDPTTTSAGIELAGRVELNRVSFTYLDKAFHKPYGNIGNVFNNCNWAENNYAYYAAWDGVVAMYAGYDKFNDGHITTSKLAGIFIDSAYDGTSHTVFNGTVIEGNNGFGVFVYNYGIEWYVSINPLVFNDVYFENNATTTPVTINAVSYTTQDVYLRNTLFAKFNRSGLVKTMTLVNSHVTTDDCFLDSTVVETLDAASSLVHNNINSYDYTSSANTITRSYGQASGVVGTNADRLVIEPRAKFVFGYTKVAGNHYTGAATYAFIGTAPTNATTVNDGIVYGTCASLAIPDGSTLYDNAAGAYSPQVGYWYVWSIDAKLMTNETITMRVVGTGSAVGNMFPQLVYNKWVTIGGIVTAASTDGVIIPYLENASGHEVTILLSAAQVIEFANKVDAQNYFNAGFYQK